MGATIFIVILCVTGFLLLHTEELRIQERLVSNESLLDLYNIQPESPPRTYYAGKKWVAQIDDQVYFELTILSPNHEILKGATMAMGIYVLAYENSIDLLTGNGELIERLTELHGVPKGIENIGGTSGDEVYLKTDKGYFISNQDLAVWEDAAQSDVTWSTQEKAPRSYTDQLLELYRGKGLPLERVITDLHSGRIFGKFGVWIVDISVFIFLVLSFTGWWSWYKRRELQKEIDEES